MGGLQCVIVAFPGDTHLLFGHMPCADPESFVRRDPALTTFFSDEGREVPNIPKSGPSSAHQRNKYN